MLEKGVFIKKHKIQKLKENGSYYLDSEDEI